MRPPSRTILWVWLGFSVLTVAYTGLLFLTSEPAGEGAAVMAHGPNGPLRPGDRVILSSVRDPRTVALAAAPGAREVLGGPGDVLVVSEGSRPSLGSLDAPAIGLYRAVLYVERNASGGYDVPMLGLRNVTDVHLGYLPTWNATTGERTFVNASVTLPSGEAPARGFVVKADAREPLEPGLVDAGNVRGVFDRSVPTVWLYVTLLFSVFAAIAPCVILITTQRPKRAVGPEFGLPLAEVAPSEPCPVCARPVKLGSSFCVGCGAILAPGRGDGPRR